jgi:bifunctional non-homologous end joining protein LigD
LSPALYDRGVAREKLSEYQRKRSFEETPEPTGKPRRRRSRKSSKDADGVAVRGRFVIQEHHARRLHWDLRLEHDGVAVSWALPKGVPEDPKQNRLAVHTEDHPLEYLEFEGDIPKGQYGAGTMRVWDRGTYEAEKFRADEVILVFDGERVNGRYALFQTDGDNWMIHRMDPPADPGREPMPKDLKPMMATLSKLPRDESAWAFEVKWDGVRGIAYCDAGSLRLESRTLRDSTRQYPELRPLATSLGSRQAVFDGEIVAFDEEGRPSFQRLQGRIHLASDSAIRRRMADTPVTYMIFDLLYLDGHLLLDLPYTERRARLESLALDGDHWRVPTYHRGDGSALLEATREQGLEGVVGKRLDSRYLPGKRTRAWLKVKNVSEQELVIGGWLPGEGRREGTLGALAVGYYETVDGRPRLRYAGRVGTGFTEDVLRDLMKRMAPLERKTSPFEGRQPPKQVRFVEPRLVAQIEFREWTQARTLRAPSFKGLRDDKDATEVTIELPVAPPEGQVEPAVTAGGSGAIELVEGPVEISGREIKLSNLDKVLYPKAGFRKRDVIAYYAAVADRLLPHLSGRPLTLKRYPDGVEGKFFYEKECPPWRPDWVRTAGVWSEGKRKDINFCLVEDLPTLVWLANLADLELHTSLARAEDPERPTMLVFDLDPGEGMDVLDTARVALMIRDLLGELGLDLLVKSSGSKGLHLHVPLNTKVAFEATGPFAHAIAALLEQREPDLVVSRMSKSRRKGRVLVDWSQNAAHKTTVSVLSLRARRRPTVAAPLRWEEVEGAVEAGDAGDLMIEAPRLLGELDERAALFEPLLTQKQKLPKPGA